MIRRSPIFALASVCLGAGILLSASSHPLRAAEPQTAPATAPASYPATPRAVMDTIVRDILATLRDPKANRDEKRAKVTDLASLYMDFDTLSRLALGQYWRGLSDAQHTEFVVEFKKHLAATYGHTTDEYTDEDINFASERTEPNGDVTVQTSILGTKDHERKEIAKVDYRLRKSADKWKIIDVTIDGVSLLANFRAQFQDIMANGGYDKLLKMLREKNATTNK